MTQIRNWPRRSPDFATVRVGSARAKAMTILLYEKPKTFAVVGKDGTIICIEDDYDTAYAKALLHYS